MRRQVVGVSGVRVWTSQCYRIRETTPVIHAAALRDWGQPTTGPVNL